jgi:23S rRNA (cytidine1920-2'-O)/16S rRNA (cytidine1409-2'-O)-methyltransferase
MAGKTRLDDLLLAQGLALHRDQALRLIMAGRVRVDGQKALNPAMVFPDTAQVEVESPAKFISRGGMKLEAALQAFQVEVSGKVCADVGASTGGFTDCLLQHGAQKVYAIDVGRGILAWKLRQHPNVAVMENTNARQVERLPSPVQLVTIDVSFISLKILLPVVRKWFIASREAGPLPDGEVFTVLALIKPQFEAGREHVDRGQGVIRDPRIHQQVLDDILTFALETGYQLKGLIASPLFGPKGNREFFAWLVWPGKESPGLAGMIADAVR